MNEHPAKSSRLFEDVVAILRDARRMAYTAANAAMVDAYWRIGRRIVEEEQGGAARAEYGSQLIRHLARALGEELGSGMSVANLRNFRQFYLSFPDAEKRYALRSELSWTHWRLVMRVDDPKARDYYIQETARQQWTSRARTRTPPHSRLAAARWEQRTMNAQSGFTRRGRNPEVLAGIATLLGLDERTVYRDWAMARAWLRQQLAG